VKHLLLLLLLALAVLAAGCSPSPESTAMAPAPEAAGQTQRAKAATAFLAYEHSLSLDTEAQKVPTLFEAAQAACRAAADQQCAVLTSNLDTGRTASASLKLRARPEGIRRIIAALSQQSEVIDQSTRAEDLEAPIADAEKKRDMLKDYRARLEALRERASHDVDALIKVNRELAQVQSDLEATEGAHARLLQRVQTEILDVSIHSSRRRSFWRPIGFALTDFGGNLSNGVSIAITGAAYLLPSALALLIVVLGARRLWRWRRGKAG
jgi:small-conductance mechanosensitive channel